MKLSEAMRLGAMMKPQAFRELFNGTGTCALGAALDAVGEELDRSYGWDRAYAQFPLLAAAFVDCPYCGETPVSLRVMVIHLNDYHGWTREQIADWVETVERAEQPEQPEPIAVATDADVRPCLKSRKHRSRTANRPRREHAPAVTSE